MAKLPYRIKRDLERLLDMEAGYVLNFSNRTFAEFIDDTVSIDIYNGDFYKNEHCSKANKLRLLINRENDYIVGKVLNELLILSRQSMWNDNNLNYNDERTFEELIEFSSNLMEGSTNLELPDAKEETLFTLLEDIKSSIGRNKPTLVLDRLHTFSTKYLRQICIKKGIEVADPKGNFLPLHSLAGMLRKHYETNNEFQSDFTVLAIQNNIQLFDKFNSIRNNQSYAHDNEILSNVEADFAIKAMANVLVFIDKVEALKQNEVISSNVTTSVDLPF